MRKDAERLASGLRSFADAFERVYRGGSSAISNSSLLAVHNAPWHAEYFSIGIITTFVWRQGVFPIIPLCRSSPTRNNSNKRRQLNYTKIRGKWARCFGPPFQISKQSLCCRFSIAAAISYVSKCMF